MPSPFAVKLPKVRVRTSMPNAFIAVDVILSNECADAEMGRDALAELVRTPQAGEWLAFQDKMPRHHLIAALRMADGGDGQAAELALQVGVGHWHATRKGTSMHEEVRTAWRKAIVRSAKMKLSVQGSVTHWLGELLSQDAELALAWLEAALVSQQDGIGMDRVAKKAAGALSKDQRLSLLDTANQCGMNLKAYFFALKWVPVCVGDDADLYRCLLACPELKEEHGLPLGGEFTEQWRGKALAALDAEYDEGFVACWGEQGNGPAFIGGISEMWREKRQKFEALRTDPDLRLRKVGQIGADRMLKLEQEERRREDIEKLRGLGDAI